VGIGEDDNSPWQRRYESPPPPQGMITIKFTCSQAGQLVSSNMLNGVSVITEEYDLSVAYNLE
jgi:hypothetical protein